MSGTGGVGPGSGGGDNSGGQAGEASVDSGGAGGVPSAPFASCVGEEGDECQGESCCTTIELPAGSFLMGRSSDGSDTFNCCGFPRELPEHDATVSAFSLDKYEVTVGRFRRFVSSYDGPPPFDAGAHSAVPFSGWRTDWNAEMPADKNELADSLDCHETATWTTDPLDGESKPISCLSWYVAFAFCIWDGGRLPSEAEWEYAAAGGDENRRYPWGAADPVEGDHFSTTGPLAIGSMPAGQARWGHRDLAGNVMEWVLDNQQWAFSDSGESDPWYEDGGNPCPNCVNLADTADKGARGGGWSLTGGFLRAAARMSVSVGSRSPGIGVRCVR